MRVLVVGGNRFVGRFLVWRLLAEDHHVTLLNRGRLPDPFADRVERLVGNRTGPDFERWLERREFEAVVDMAAYTGEDGRQVVEVLCGRVGHYIMVSSGQVYLVREGCPHPAREPAAEEYYEGPVMARPADPADIRDWEYGIGKRSCEDALAAAACEGFPATRIRIPMVYGPRDYNRRMEAYLWRLLDGGPVLLPDGGDQRLRHVDAEEVARFLSSILMREQTYGRAFNLAQEEAPRLIELLEELRSLLGSRARIIAVPKERLHAAGLRPKDVSPFHDPWMSFLDPSRARDKLGFRHAPLSRRLAVVTASFLAHTRADRPVGYAGRDIERRLAG